MKRPLASESAVTWRKYADHLEGRNAALERALDRTLGIMIVVVRWAAGIDKEETP